MRVCLFVFFFFSSLFAYELSFPEPKTEEEALLIRRLSAYWEEKETNLITFEVAQFLEKYPDTSLSDTLYLLQGNLSFQKEEYEKALSSYEKANFSHLNPEALLNKMEVLRKLNQYKTIYEESQKALQERVLDGYTQEQLEFFLADSLYNLTIISPKESKEFFSYAEKSIQAINHLEESPLKESFEKPLAYLYESLGKKEDAEKLYLKLAEKIPEEKEAYLFKVAEMQLSTDKEKALKTLTRISHLGREKAEEAFYNRLLLLFDMGLYSELVLAKEQADFSFPEDKQNHLSLLLGKSYYRIQDFKRCKEELLPLTEKLSSSVELKDTYLSLLDACKETQDLFLYEKLSKKFESAFPEDSSLPNVIWVRSLLYKENHKPELAKQDFLFLLESFPLFEKKEPLFFEYATAEFEAENWEKARSLFSEYLSFFTEEERGKVAASYCIEASLKNVKNNPEKEEAVHFLIEDLQTVLSIDNLLPEETEHSYHFLLTKTLFEKGDPTSFKETAFTFLEKNPSKDLAAKTHLLLAYSYQEGDLSLFCEHAEKALDLSPNLEDAGKVHLSLFNAYLESENMEEAASHLFSCYMLKEPMQLENKLWLAYFYYKKTVSLPEEAPLYNLLQNPIQDKEAAKKSLSLYEDLLQTHPSLILENGTLELETIRLSKLYQFLEKTSEQKAVLEELYLSYEKEKTAPWVFKTELFFELGSFYEKESSDEKAFFFYEKAYENSSLSQKLGAQSAYQMASLLIKTIPQENPSESYPFKRASQLLKDLSLHKSFSQEPIHLEASFRYIDLQLKKKEEGEKPFLKLFLLEKVKDNFTLEEDLLSKDYHEERRQTPEKEALFKAYLTLVDAEMLFSEASLLLKENNNKEALELHKEALSLLKKTYPYTPFLEERLEKNFKDWESLILTKPE